MTHVGVNARCGHVLDVLRRAVSLAIERGCGALVVAGDLLDVDKPTPQLIAAVQDVLAPVPCVLLLGNHEQHSAEPGDHALAPLAPVATVVDEPRCIAVPGTGVPLDLLCVPFQPGPANVWLPRAAEWAARGARPGSERVLVMHLGVSDEETVWFLRGAHDSVTAAQAAGVARSVGARTVIAGNWHNHHRWSIDGVDVVQVGTLCPVGYRDGGTDGRGLVALVDSGAEAEPPWHVAAEGKSVTMVRVPGPRFVQVGDVGAISAAVSAARADGADPLYVEATVPPADVALAQSMLDGLQASHVVEAFDVLPTRGDAVRSAESEAAADAVETGDDPIDAYVDAMDLPEEVTRAEVREAVRGALARARGK